MTKETNIFDLYRQLNKSGQRGEAQKFIANLCNVKVGTVKNHWISSEELPEHIDDWKQDQIITYLQNTIAVTNSF